MGRSWSEPYYVVIEIENRSCKVSGMLKAKGFKQFRILDVNGLSAGSVKHLVELPQGSVAGSPERREGRAFATFESEGCDVCNTILSHGSFLVSGKCLHGFIFIYSFVTPGFKAYRDIVSSLKAKGFRLKVLKAVRFFPRKSVLTERQERVLWLAFKTGFFDYPRKVDTIELSRALGVSPSTLSEMMRRGIRRLLEAYFEPASPSHP